MGSQLAHNVGRFGPRTSPHLSRIYGRSPAGSSAKLASGKPVLHSIQRGIGRRCGLDEGKSGARIFPRCERVDFPWLLSPSRARGGQVPAYLLAKVGGTLLFKATF